MSATERAPLRRVIMGAVPLVVAVGLFAFFYKTQHATEQLGGHASDLPSPLVGHPAPPLQLAALDGAPITDADLRKGKVTVINVFGSWCEPCHYEHPALLALAADADVKAGKVEIIGMAQKDKPENVRRFLGAEGDPYARVALDPDNRAGIDWGVYGVPETYVIKADGSIAYKFIGPLTEDTLKSVLLPQIRKAEG